VMHQGPAAAGCQVQQARAATHHPVSLLKAPPAGLEYQQALHLVLCSSKCGARHGSRATSCHQSSRTGWATMT
jgi:hypothetical protein